MRIKRQRETFAYRLADMSTPFIIGDGGNGRGSGGGSGGRGRNEKASPVVPDANTPRGNLSGPWTSNPNKWNQMAEAEQNRSGPKMPKRVITPGAPSGSSGGSAGGNTARPSGGGSGAVGDNGIMDISRPLYNLIKEKYPDVEIGGYREDWAGEHAKGALDIMHPYNHGIDPNWVIQEGFKAGAPWAIWEQQMHYPDGRRVMMEDRSHMGPAATQNHFDHVHIGPLM